MTHFEPLLLIHKLILINIVKIIIFFFKLLNCIIINKLLIIMKRYPTCLHHQVLPI